jgi:hypothetical protein
MMIIIPEVGYGAGRHVDYINPKENITKGLHLNFVTQPLCLIGLCLTKISVGFFLLRMAPSPRFRYFIWAMMIFTFLSAAGNFCTLTLDNQMFSDTLTELVTVFFQCQPLALTWDSTVDGKCIEASQLKFAAFFNSSKL